jgi:hypothetical protein
MTVYKAMQAVSADLAKEGIGKTSVNAQQGFSFRGIDSVMNTLAPLLAKHGLLLLPRYTNRTVTERTTQRGTVVFSVVLEGEFTFVAVEDGSAHTVRLYGEAMDTGDKATNKAMAAAYKYACVQAFCIPTEGDNDADATTQEPIAAPAPEGYADWLQTMTATADTGMPALVAAWKASKASYREHIRATNLQGWEHLKATAQKAAVSA